MPNTEEATTKTLQRRDIINYLYKCNGEAYSIVRRLENIEDYEITQEKREIDGRVYKDITKWSVDTNSRSVLLGKMWKFAQYSKSLNNIESDDLVRKERKEMIINLENLAVNLFIDFFVSLRNLIKLHGTY